MPDKRKGEKGLLKRTTVTGEHKYWLFVPENYNPNVSQALLVHMHLPGKKEEKDFDEFASAWTDQCEKKNIILLMPVTENEAGWLPGDATAIAEMVRDVLERYTIDRQRIVSYGIGVGGQLALHLGFNNRDLFRGVVASGAVAAYPRDNVKDRRSGVLYCQRRARSAARVHWQECRQAAGNELSGDHDADCQKRPGALRCCPTP